MSLIRKGKACICGVALAPSHFVSRLKHQIHFLVGSFCQTTLLAKGENPYLQSYSWARKIQNDNLTNSEPTILSTYHFINCFIIVRLT